MTTLRLTLFVVATLVLTFVLPQRRRRPAPGPRGGLLDESRIAIVDPATGKLEWDHRIDNIHDLHRLPDGNILFQTSMTRLLEVEPKANKVVWEYDAKSQTATRVLRRGPLVSAFAEWPTMIAERAWDALSRWTRERRKADQAQGSRNDPHRDTRLVRKLDNGHYLVAHEGEGAAANTTPTAM